MVMSYSEFMASHPVSHFTCGEKPHLQTLGKFSKRSGSDSSEERMERLKEMLRQSKTGRQTLEFLEEKGSQMCFEPMDYCGYFSPDDNRVALNPAMSDEDLAVTFVHEVRHAWQDSQMATLDPALTVDSFLVNGYLIEADACAAEVMYAHEMRETNPEIWNAHQRSGYAPMSTAFERTFQKTGDAEQARAAAMLEWYNLPVSAQYTSSYVDYLSQISIKAAYAREEVFTEKVPAQEMVDTLCHDYDNKQFFTDGKELETSEKLRLPEKKAKKLMKNLNVYMNRMQKTPEQLGLDKITVEKPNAQYGTCADYAIDNRPMAKQKAPVSSVIANRATSSR